MKDLTGDLINFGVLCFAVNSNNLNKSQNWESSTRYLFKINIIKNRTLFRICGVVNMEMSVLIKYQLDLSGKVFVDKSHQDLSLKLSDH